MHCENSILRLMDEVKYMKILLENYINNKNEIDKANYKRKLKEEIEKIFQVKTGLENFAKRTFEEKFEHTFFRDEQRSLLNQYISRINEQIYNFEQKYKVTNIAISSKNAEIIKFNNNDKAWTSHSTYSNIFNLLNPFGNVDIIINPDKNLNECWTIDSNEGVFSLKTEYKVQPFAFSFTHKLNDNNSDAIRNFTIYGLHYNEIWQWDFLGTYFFIIEDEEVTYLVFDENSMNVKIEKNGDQLKEYFICFLSNCQNEYQYFRIEFQNYGDHLHTCIYRFELYIKN